MAKLSLSKWLAHVEIIQRPARGFSIGGGGGGSSSGGSNRATGDEEGGRRGRMGKTLRASLAKPTHPL